MALWTPSSPAMAISSPRCHEDLDGPLVGHLRREGPRHEDLVGRAAGEQCPPPTHHRRDRNNFQYNYGNFNLTQFPQTLLVLLNILFYSRCPGHDNVFYSLFKDRITNPSNGEAMSLTGVQPI